MKNKKKTLKILLLIALILLIIVVIMIVVLNNMKKEEQNNNSVNPEIISGEFAQVVENGIKLNVSTQLNSTKHVDNLEITNIQLINKGDQSILTADVKNTSENSTNLTLINVIMLDKDGNEIGLLEGIIGELGANETTQLNLATQEDYSNAYDFKINKK